MLTSIFSEIKESSLLLLMTFIIYSYLLGQLTFRISDIFII